MIRGGLVALVLVVCASCGSTPGSARLPLERAADAPPTPTIAPPPRDAAPTTQATTPPPTTTTTIHVPPANAILTPRGFALPVDGRAAGGWVVETPCGNLATLAKGTPLATPTVILDPGHGGSETGAVGPNGLRESVLNLAVSRIAQSALEANGVSVLLTRPGDDRVVLTTRSALVRKLRPTVFVSVHHNASPDEARNSPGTETYYQHLSPQSKRLAGLIYEEVFKALSAYQVPWFGSVDAGAKYRLNEQGGDFYHVLRETAGTPSVIAELMFLSDAPEEALLERPDVQQAEGQAVARGILRYLRTQDPGSGYVTPIPRGFADNGGGSQGCVDPPL